MLLKCIMKISSMVHLLTWTSNQLLMFDYNKAGRGSKAQGVVGTYPTCCNKFNSKCYIWKTVREGKQSTINPSNAEATFIQSTGRKDFGKPSKPCHVCIHRKALTEYSKMSTHFTGIQSFFRFFASFCIGQISHHQFKG